MLLMWRSVSALGGIAQKPHHGVVHNLLLNKQMLEMAGMRLANVFMIGVFVHARLALGRYCYRKHALGFTHRVG